LKILQASYRPKKPYTVVPGLLSHIISYRGLQPQPKVSSQEPVARIQNIETYFNQVYSDS